MQFTVRAVYRQVLGTWFLLLVFLVTCLSIDTGNESPAKATSPQSLSPLAAIISPAPHFSTSPPTFPPASQQCRSLVPDSQLGLPQRADLSPLPESPQLITGPSRSEAQIKAENNAFVGILVQVAVILLVLLTHLVRLDFFRFRPTNFGLLTPNCPQPRSDRRDHKSVSAPFPSLPPAQPEGDGSLELYLPSEPQHLPPLLEDNATCYPLPSALSQVECESVEGYKLYFTEEHQAEEEASVMDHSEPADVSPNVNIHHPAVPSACCSFEPSTTVPTDAIDDDTLSFGHLFQNDDEDGSEDDEEELLAPIKGCLWLAVPLQTNQPQRVPLEPDSQVSNRFDSLRANEKAEEDVFALDPQASEPNGTGIGDLSARVSGTPIPHTGSIGARKLGPASSVPLAPVSPLRSILRKGTSSSISKPGKSHDSDTDLSAQVSGTVSKTGFRRKLRVNFDAAVSSTKRSRVIVRANLERIKDAGKRGFKASRTRHVSEEQAYRTWSKGKWRGPELDDDFFEEDEVVDGDDEDTDEDGGDMIEDDEDLDEEGFSKLEQAKAIAESRCTGQLPFYGASTSARLFSDEEWEGLEQYQGVRSETVEPQPEVALTELSRRRSASSMKRGWRRFKRVVSCFLC